MALDTFKARLKAKLKAAGVNLSQKRIDAIADRLHQKFPDVTEDADHDTHIDDLDAVQPFKEIAAFDDYQRTKEAKKDKPADKKDEKKEDVETPADDVPAWAKGLIESNKALQQTVQQLQSEKTKASMQTRLKESLKDIPATFYDEWALPETEEALETFQDKVKTKWEAFTKENPVQQATSGHKPGRGTGKTTNEPSKEELDAIVKDIM